MSGAGARPGPFAADAGPASSVNAAVRAARELKSAQGRREQGLFLLEGVRLVGDALEQGLQPELVFITPHLLEATARGQQLAYELRRSGLPLIELSERLLSLVSDTETPAGIVALARLPAPQPYIPFPSTSGLSAVLLDQVRDPGNVGGIMRSAGAAGLDLIVSTEGSVDLFAPKVVRAGAGAHLRLEICNARPVAEAKDWLARWPQVILADGRSPVSLYEVDWRAPTVLVLSNEAHGAADWLDDAQARRVRIPMRQHTESLNVAAAAAIFIYEARRHFLRSIR